MLLRSKCLRSRSQLRAVRVDRRQGGIQTFAALRAEVGIVKALPFYLSHTNSPNFETFELLSSVLQKSLIYRLLYLEQAYAGQSFCACRACPAKQSA